MAYIYKHIRKDTNEIFYIGIGKIRKRINSIANRNSHWKHIVNKVGFDYEIIEDNLSWDEACEKEKYWIKFYGRQDLNEGILVNMTNGGDGVIGNTNRKHSEETKIKIGNSNRGKVGNKTGLTFSDETKLKMRLSAIGKYKSIEIRLKMSLAKQKMTDETKNKIGIATKKRFEIETNPASIQCIDIISGNRYKSIKDMANELNIPYKKLYYLISYSTKNTRYKKIK